MRRTSALAAVMALCVGTAPWVGTAPTAVAAPSGGNDSGPEWPTVTLSDLGSQSSISFRVNRNNAGTSVSFPVPVGMTPTALEATVELPVNLKSGTLWVSQGDRTIARLQLPDKDQTAVVLPLNGVQVFGNWASLDLRLTAIALDDYCWNPDAPIRLVNPAVTFGGSELPPTTVAGFLPSVLHEVTIGLPAKPSPAESTAAVQLAAALATRSGQKPAFTFVPLPDGATTLPAGSRPMERQIIVKEGPKKGLSLQGGPVPSLLVSGPANELAGQVVLLGDDALKYAASSGAVAESLPTQPLVGDKTTLKELTGSGPTSESLWPTVGIELDQTRWGHPVAGVSVHLRGSYTPLPSTLGGEVLASVGGEVLDRWPADAPGDINRTITIPDRLLRRSTVLEVAIRVTGDPGHCGDHLPVTLRVDGSTEITVGRANPPMPPGFQSAPQMFMPRVRVGIGPDAFGDTVRAAQIVVGLQRASAAPLVTEVMPLARAIESPESVVLVSAGGWNDAATPLPFSTDHGRVTVNGVDTKGQSVTLNLEPAAKFGSVQAFYDGQRSLLVATSNGAPAQLDELLRYLAGDSGRWAGLSGRAILSVAGREPITVPNPPEDYSVQNGAPSGEVNWFWWAAGGVAALAALGAVGILMRARRS